MNSNCSFFVDKPDCVCVWSWIVSSKCRSIERNSSNEFVARARGASSNNKDVVKEKERGGAVFSVAQSAFFDEPTIGTSGRERVGVIESLCNLTNTTKSVSFAQSAIDSARSAFSSISKSRKTFVVFVIFGIRTSCGFIKKKGKRKE